MPKKNRVAIYEYLFKEGVMVAKKDFHAPKHPELETIPNLQVIKAMQVRILIILKLLCGTRDRFNRSVVCVILRLILQQVMYSDVSAY